MMKMNIANKLTVLRMIAVPVFIFLLLSGMDVVALLVFALAAYTDFLDGYLARKLGLITKFGKFMDPIADKLLVTSALVCFVELGRLPSWVVIIILSREFIVSILRTIAASENIVIAASIWGKLKTISQMIMVLILLMHNAPFEQWGIPMDQIWIGIATVLTVISGVDYLWKHRYVLSEN